MGANLEEPEQNYENGGWVSLSIVGFIVALALGSVYIQLKYNGGSINAVLMLIIVVLLLIVFLVGPKYRRETATVVIASLGTIAGYLLHLLT